MITQVNICSFNLLMILNLIVELTRPRVSLYIFMRLIHALCPNQETQEQMGDIGVL